MKISEIEKLKNKNTSERELKKYSLLSFWKGMVEYKGKLTKIIFALCHAKKDIKKTRRWKNGKMIWKLK